MLSRKSLEFEIDEETQNTINKLAETRIENVKKLNISTLSPLFYLGTLGQIRCGELHKIILNSLMLTPPNAHDTVIFNALCEVIIIARAVLIASNIDIHDADINQQIKVQVTLGDTFSSIEQALTMISVNFTTLCMSSGSPFFNDEADDAISQDYAALLVSIKAILLFLGLDIKTLFSDLTKRNSNK